MSILLLYLHRKYFQINQNVANMKHRFLVRRLQQADLKNACECFESYHSSINDAFNEFDIAMFNARIRFYVLLEIFEIGDDDEYYLIKCVKLTWL